MKSSTAKKPPRLSTIVRSNVMARPKPNDPITKRLVSKLQRLADNGNGKKTTGWEKTFLKEVRERVSKYGSAFCDDEKGDLSQSLSTMQYYKMREIDRMIRYREKRKLGGKRAY